MDISLVRNHSHVLHELFLVALIFLLFGCSSESDRPSVSSDPPTVTLNVSSSTLPSGDSVTLSWVSSNAEQCTAGGDWSGVKDTSGDEVRGPVTSNQTYTLTCSNNNGSSTASVSVTIALPNTPSLNFGTNISLINYGENVTLAWSSNNVISCTASGDWSGSKATAGTETIGPLTNNSSFNLSCSGAGGTETKIVNVTVLLASGDGISGVVDSSMVNRLGVNKVYVYAGNVTPDDIDGDSGDPLLVVDVNQTPGTCNFSYAVTGLNDGDYTLAFTADAGYDQAGQDDAITFSGTYAFTYNSSPLLHDLVMAANILKVGPARIYRTVQEAVAAASEGDVIEVDAGDYPDDIIVFRTNYLTVRGVDGRAHIRGTYMIPYTPGSDTENGMGLWINKSTGLTVENIEFSNARVADENGAGIRNQGNDLVICNSYFHNNEDGFLGGAYGTLLIEYSEFNLNGWTDLGRNHNMYIDDGDKFILRHSYSHHAKIGHNVKTRARENHILYNRIMDEADGTSSYAIDIPNGGLTYIIGNLVQQGPNTDNTTMVPYGAEGLSGDGRTHKIYAVNNTFVNDNGSGTFLDINGGTVEAKSANNIFTGGGNPLNGPATESNNLVSTDPGLVDIGNYDYHLTPVSAARNAGIDPGQGEGKSLTPSFQYVDPISREDRPADATIDIGAFEYQ